MLRSGEPYVVHLASTETCASGGTLDIYLEPYLPKPHLVIIGHLPVAEAMVRLAKPLGFRVSVMTPEGHPDQFPDADSFSESIDLSEASAGETFVVIASHGNYDAEALEAVAKAESTYVALVSSKKRAASLGVPEHVSFPRGSTSAPLPPRR